MNTDLECSRTQTATPRLNGSSAVLLTIVLLSGCANPLLQLRSEDDSPEHRALKQEAQSIPTETVLVTIPRADGRAQKLALHETHSAPAGRTVVLVHGVMSDSRVWRFVKGGLGREYNLVMVDLPGCGASPRPACFKADTRSPYSPPCMARAVLEALRQRLESRSDDERLTLVGHSLGGMVILRMYADEQIRTEYADVLERVDGVVLFAPADVDMAKEPASLRRIALTSPFEFQLADFLGVLPREVVAACKVDPIGVSTAFREDAERLLNGLRKPDSLFAIQNMLHHALPRDRNEHLDRKQIEAIVAGYKHVTVPCVIAWGGKDEVLPAAMGEKLATELPQSCLRKLPNSTHSLPTERPRACAALICDAIAARQVDAMRIAVVDEATGLIANTTMSGGRFVSAAGR